MFEDIKEAIQYIESKIHQRTLEEFRQTLKELNIETKQKNMIHVAGTNGKGSTINYLRAILNAHGYKVGTFVSPFLYRHNDIMRIDNISISDDALLMYINKYYKVIEEKKLSTHEIEVLIMLDYFSGDSVDYRLIEVNIGGANDMTNVIEPDYAVITNIGRDHQDVLKDILAEKMGIIKPNTTFITAEFQGNFLAKMQDKCDRENVQMIVVPEYQVTKYPFHFMYRNMEFTFVNRGIYQVFNARLALTIANKLIHLNPDITIKAVEEAVWRGRFEKISFRGREVIVDGAHNTEGICALLRTIKLAQLKNVSIIFACEKDENVDNIIKQLVESKHKIYLTTYGAENMMTLEEFSKYQDVTVIQDYSDAIKASLIKNETVVVAGTLGFIGRVRNYLRTE